jgi:diadenylate cyclase
MAEVLALVAPGRPLREGLERVLLAKRGALVVVGDDPAVLSICTGGFLFDAEFSPQRLSELAKMDGAIIVSGDAVRIARANVHLMPNSSIPTTETGTRHRTAERVARSIDVPVITVSAAMGIVTVYRGTDRHVLQPASRLHDQVSQALQAMQRFRQRFDLAVTALSVLEVEDTVTLRDVVAVLQPAELVVRITEEIEITLVELGADGRLLRLQLDELVDGVDDIRRLVVRDYLQPAPGLSDGARRQSDAGICLDRLSVLSTDDLLDPHQVAAVLGLEPTEVDLDAPVEPRGFRMLHRLPRFPEAVVDRIVAHFAGLQRIMRASAAELEEVDGVGAQRARTVKDGLARLAEANIFDRYS